MRILLLVFALTHSTIQGHEHPEDFGDEFEIEDGGESYCPHLYKQGNAVCNLFPDSIEGPFYRSNQYERWDVREDRGGVTVVLFVTLAEVRNCQPIKNVAVDIWSADAAGEYSAFVGAGPGDPPSDNSTFLRGVQRSDENGKLMFITIFPGWYEGRTVHYHMAIHTRDKKHTVQLYANEATTKDIAQQYPYSQSPKQRTTNNDDGFYTKDAELTLEKRSWGYSAQVLMAFRVRRRRSDRTI